MSNRKSSRSPSPSLALIAALVANAAGAAIYATEPPPCPGPESWTFRQELAQPTDTLPPVSAQGKPWVKNRISRCFFGPIKRAPLFHDELMDDVDYYPDAYLDRLAREGVNGLWLTVEWRDLAETSFTRRCADAPRRLAKLRKTVAKCLRHGIKTWIFAIEPHDVAPDDPLCLEHPEMFNPNLDWNRRHVMCPSSPDALRYVEESVCDIFRSVPDLGGLMMIANGERPTTCLSFVHPVDGARRPGCPKCDGREPWQLYRDVAAAVVRGIRKAGSSAEYVSWFYHPQVPAERADWVAECARHVPEGTIFAYNFESGAEREQLGKVRHGGDYWLSYEGPADGFVKVAAAAREAGAQLGAKIQVCNCHELATLPYVPVPGLLYRKYRAMKAAGVSTVLQCWYFGNCPGVMNRAAGLLSHSDFSAGEDEFLLSLAKSEWGADAAEVADVWKRLSDAYAQYPLSNDMQYYGPFHAGAAWPLFPDVQMAPLGRTWKPQDPPSGDAIGECLENHTLEEACVLAERMVRGAALPDAEGRDRIAALKRRHAAEPERIRDLGLITALQCHFASAADVFAFYRDRATALYASRVRGDRTLALAAIDRMDAAIVREGSVTRRLLPLAESDSRIGFHSEAEVHQYHPAKLRWRLGELAAARRRLVDVRAAVACGEPYPESDWERRAERCRVGGDWVRLEGGRFRVCDEGNGDFTVEVETEKGVPAPTTVRVFDAAATRFWNGRRLKARGDKGAATASFGAEEWDRQERDRPGWLMISSGGKVVWPTKAEAVSESRLNIGPFTPRQFGRLIR